MTMERIALNAILPVDVKFNDKVIIMGLGTLGIITALYYQMMNALYDAVLILDDNGHVVDCNERASSIFGHSREELWDVAVTTLIPGINPQIFAKMKDGLHGNRRVLINARCHRKDGSTFHGEVGAGLMDLTGENLVLTVRNIEKRAPIRAIIRPAANSASEETGN